MLSKDDHISYWVSTAQHDWERALFMYEKKDFVFCLFCVHLCLEKLSKALWVKENPNNNYPPRIHDIKHLLADTSFLPNKEQSFFIDAIQKYQIEGQIPRLQKTYFQLYYTGLHRRAAK